VLAEPAAGAIRRLAAGGERFDLVFADPPYSRGELPAELAGVRGLLAEGGLVIVQADLVSPVPNLPGLAVTARRAYGRNVFHFLGLL
jgi:16S rRNA G966 N2-methylase RsmD